MLALSFQSCTRPTHDACNRLFEHLHDYGKALALRFAQQQMHVFGHDHIPGDCELMAAANLFRHAQKKIACP